jgi:DNA-binding transcriptional regulator YhcF (GntR family)
MNGWVKLHAQIIENDVWRNDRTAWHIFEYLLIKAYSGKPQGTVVTSRYQIADMVGGNNNTIYKAVKRLEKAKMVTTVATNKKTIIRICNWQKYQGNGNHSGNNKVTTKQQQSNTLIRIKNKDIRNNTNVELQATQLVFDHFIKQFGKEPNRYKLSPQRKKKIDQRLKDSGKDMLMKAITNTAETPFYRGDNERGWEADLDFIVRSYEQVERLANMKDKQINYKADW